MLSNAVENKIVFFNPFSHVTLMPIILGIIIASLLSAVLSFNQSNESNGLSSNVMLRHKVVVKCESPYSGGGKAGRKTHYFPRKCPIGWGQVG